MKKLILQCCFLSSITLCASEPQVYTVKITIPEEQELTQSSTDQDSPEFLFESNNNNLIPLNETNTAALNAIQKKNPGVLSYAQVALYFLYQTLKKMLSSLTGPVNEVH